MSYPTFFNRLATWLALMTILMLALAGVSYAVGPGDIISTVAGSGTLGYSGDGGPATAAELYGPFDVTLDAAGNLYIADGGNNVIRRVDTAGVITTVAGNGTPGYSGDGGPATAAQLAGPRSVVLDAAGNLYIADRANHRIRKVDTSGVITTVAGNGTQSYGGDGGPATAARLQYPSSITLDAAGNLYIADTDNNRIRRVDTSGIITTVAGTGILGYSGDGGPATAAQLYFPKGVVLDAAGNLYIADSFNNRIRKIDTAGVITTVAGNGSQGYSGDGGLATAAQLNHPHGMALDAAGNLYFANASKIRQIDTFGIITTVAGTGSGGYNGDGIPAGAATLGSPFSLALDAAGNLYIADTNNQRIRKVTPSGGDTAAPSIAITTPAGGAVFSFGQVVTAGYACQDEAGGSGLASCAGPSPNGSAIDTSVVGVHTFTVNAADNAGNQSTLTHTYTVAYNPSFSNNFGAPVSSPPTLNEMKAGSSAPVKFDLGGDFGLNILANGYPKSQPVVCDNSAPVGDIGQETTTSNSGLQYDAASGQYTYVWKTQQSWAGTCRQFTLRLADGTDHIALFKFR